jgi:hypothetical protein
MDLESSFSKPNYYLFFGAKEEQKIVQNISKTKSHFALNPSRKPPFTHPNPSLINRYIKFSALGGMRDRKRRYSVHKKDTISSSFLQFSKHTILHQTPNFFIKTSSLSFQEEESIVVWSRKLRN